MRRIYEYEDLQPVLEQLLQDRESGDMEFKSAKGGFPHSMWETCSSFANTDGGAIVFGIKEKDEQFFLDGLTEAQVKKDGNVALTDGNVALTDANVGLSNVNVGLVDANVGLQRKRYSKTELRELVLSFCTQWRTAEEIALYIGRNLVYVKNRVLPQMSDVIEKMYDIPHHPRQKYRAKQQM